MNKYIKKLKDKIDVMTLRKDHRESIRKKSEVADNIISGVSFFKDRRIDIRGYDVERRHT